MAEDAGRKATDKELLDLKKKLNGIYQEAQRDLKRKMLTFVEKHHRQDEQKRKDMADGKITPDQYASWLLGQVFQGRMWHDKLKSITKTLVDTNRRAVKELWKKLLRVFSIGFNYQNYKVEHDLGVDTGFNVYNPETVERIVRDDPKVLPEWKINEQKDYIWNAKKVRDIVTQGVIQGESVPQIAERLAKELQTTNANKMMMFARTAVNGAQNAGRLEAMRKQKELGIDVQKRWLATKDKRTRDAHRDLDGDVADLDAPFHAHLHNGSPADIIYPGDPDAPAELVYNCRCTMTYFYPGIDELPKKVKRDDSAKHESFEQWQKKKEGGSDGKR